VKWDEAGITVHYVHIPYVCCIDVAESFLPIQNALFHMLFYLKKYQYGNKHGSCFVTF